MEVNNDLALLSFLKFEDEITCFFNLKRNGKLHLLFHR